MVLFLAAFLDQSSETCASTGCGKVELFPQRSEGCDSAHHQGALCLSASTSSSLLAEAGRGIRGLPPGKPCW